jgi:glutathione S-transferase
MSSFLSVAEARAHDGVRLVLTAGAPGPWGEAIKGMLYVKKIPYVRVRQEAGSDNPELVAWTGVRNAPQIISGDEKPLHAWADLIQFAERCAATPSLVPQDPNERVRMFGLIRELAGADGFAWNRRLSLFKPIMDLVKQKPNPAFASVELMAGEYGYDDAAAEQASDKVAEILTLLSEQLRSQGEAHSRFLIGDQLSALDIYWAAFAALISPLPEELCPMPDYLRQSYGAIDDTIAAAAAPSLLEHRDFIYETFLELPVIID